MKLRTMREIEADQEDKRRTMTYARKHGLGYIMERVALELDRLELERINHPDYRKARRDNE